MRMLITGANGMLARALQSQLADCAFELRTFTRQQLDITDATAVCGALGDVKPDVVVNCAAYTRVDDAERAEEQAFRVNAVGAGYLARACRDVGARFVYLSSDYIFDGESRTPYAPDAQPNPVNVYGRTKLAGEQAATAAADYLVVRSSWLYGDGGRNFVRAIAARLRAGVDLRVVANQRGAPTWTHDLAAALVRMLERAAPTGVYHIANAGSATWHEFACEIAQALGIRADIQPVTTEEYGAPAPRPRYSVLDCSTAQPFAGRMRDWKTALHEAVSRGLY